MMALGDLIKSNNNFGYAYVEANASKKKKKVKSSGIKDEELVMMYKDLKETFQGRFSNSDLDELCAKWGLSKRQTPSRLGKMASNGLLERFETKPYSYEVK